MIAGKFCLAMTPLMLSETVSCAESARTLITVIWLVAEVSGFMSHLTYFSRKGRNTILAFEWFHAKMIIHMLR